MILNCELQIPKTAYEIENQKRIAVIKALTDITIDQSGNTGFTLGILTSNDVYAMVYSDNPIELLKLLISLQENSDFILEFGSDDIFEKEGSGYFTISKTHFNDFKNHYIL
jgi:uncharacterized protein with ACT and thioredoxin-like domain